MEILAAIITVTVVFLVLWVISAINKANEKADHNHKLIKRMYDEWKTELTPQKGDFVQYVRRGSITNRATSNKILSQCDDCYVLEDGTKVQKTDAVAFRIDFAYRRNITMLDEYEQEPYPGLDRIMLNQDWGIGICN